MLNFSRVTEWIPPGLRKPAAWVGVALSGAAAVFVQSQFSWGFGKVSGLSESLVEEWKCQHRKASIKLSDDEFATLVSPLKGDTNGIQKERIIATLGDQGGFQVSPICPSLQIDVGGEYTTEKLKAMARGQDILKEWHADLILFGRVYAPDDEVHIYAVNEHGGCASSDEPLKFNHGALEGELRPKLYGTVLSAIAAACRHGDNMDWVVFDKQMKKLTKLIFGSALGLHEQLDYASYYNGLNLLYHHDGNQIWIKAASAFTDLLLSSKRTDLEKADALFFYGRALLSQGTKTRDTGVLTESIKVFEQALPMIPSPERKSLALSYRSDAFFQKGEDVLGMRDLDEAIRLLPVSSPEQRARALMKRADAHSRKGDNGLAVQDLDEAIQLDPKSAPAYTTRGNAYSAKGDNDRAIADYNEAIRLDPKSAEAYNNRGNAYRVKGDNDRAIADYDEVIRLDPKSAYAYSVRGRAYLYSGNPAKALADVIQASELDQTDAYNALWVDIVGQRNNIPSRLSQAVAKIDMTVWPAPVIHLFLGQMTPNAVIAAADDPDATKKKGQVCEANFFGGEWALRSGAKDEAIRLFRLAANDCPNDFVEWDAANAELKELGGTAVTTILSQQ